MTDIVEALRVNNITIALPDGSVKFVRHVAADEIEMLREEKRQMALQYLTSEGQWIEETGRLREALRDIACDCEHDCADSPLGLSPVTPNCCRNFARAALGEKE